MFQSPAKSARPNGVSAASQTQAAFPLPHGYGSGNRSPFLLPCAILVLALLVVAGSVTAADTRLANADQSAAPTANAPISVPAASEPTTSEQDSRTPESDSKTIAQISDRAKARWQALIERDMEAVYGFETPAYRATHTQAQHAGRFGAVVNWTGAEVIRVTTDPKDQTPKDQTSIDLNGQADESSAPPAATVQVRISYTAPAPTGNTYDSQRVLTERWMLQEGQWWYLSN